MKSRKRKSTSRLTAFLLFLSMLLSTVAVFPSSVLAVESEGESIDESQELPLEEDLALQDPIDVGFETEFEGFDENTVSTALSLSNPVYDDGASTTIRPNGNNVDLSVGDTLIVRIQSTVTNFKSIEVSIDNTSVMSYEIVTQNYSGLMFIRVSALNVGTVTVTAEVTYWINSSVTATETATLELYVTMDDGIYAIKSCADHLPTTYGDYYLRAESYYKETPDLYASTNTYGDLTEDIYYYWQIKYAGYGEYYIQPIADLDQYLTIEYVTSDFELRVGNSDDWAEWVIGYQDGEYVIETAWLLDEGIVINAGDVNTGYYLSDQDYPYYYAGVVLFEERNWSYNRWEFISVDLQGLSFRDIGTDELNESFTVTKVFREEPFSLEDLGYDLVSYGYDESTCYPIWSSSPSSIATVDASTGLITANKCGTVIFTVSIYGTSLTNSFTVTFKMIEDGTYFLRNLQNGMYADIEGGTMSSGIAAEQQTFDGANTQKWIFTHIGSNVYTIRSTKNNSYYLGVQNDSTADETPIVLRTGTVTNGMKWKVEKANQGYKIVSYSNSTRVLCTSTASATAGSNLKLSDFQSGNNSYQDEWLLSLPSSQLRLEGQQTDKWCWVASAKIASYRYQDSPITQACAAVYVKLNNTITMHPDTIEEFANIQLMGGSTEDIKEALEYITGVECFEAWHYIYSAETLQSLLDNNIPVIITRGVYEPKGSSDATKENSGMERTGGHAMVINSYRWNDTTNEYEYEIYDPWEPNIGKIEYWTYDRIKRQNKDDHYRVWDGIVTFAQGNYSTLENWSGTQ